MTYKFEAIIQQVENKDATFIEIPFDVKSEFGKGRVKVHVLFDNEPYDGIMVRMKTPCHIIGLRKDIRKKLCKQAGDIVHVIIKER